MLFKKRKKKITVGFSPGDKYLAQIEKGETIDFKKMAVMIEKSTTVSKGDALNVLDAMSSTAVWMLQEGHPVKFDGLGQFTPKAKVKAVDTPEEVTEETIENIGIRYTPTVELKSLMKSVSIRILPLDEETPEP